MNKLYAPWRHNYVTKQLGEKSKTELKNNCVFCDQFAQEDDAKYLILKRFEHTAVMLNYYPYNAGHLMVLPLEHKATLNDLDKTARSELMEATNLSNNILQNVMNCEGMNIGINLGIAGGGGIPSHLHIHLLPRWRGDTNFLATLGETTLVCSDFYKIYKDLKEPFAKSIL
jgi:ATP adenylyltransferase